MKLATYTGDNIAVLGELHVKVQHGKQTDTAAYGSEGKWTMIVWKDLAIKINFGLASYHVS